jgi:CCR4-NOT transcriptional regulation complex NOT5 subunit
MNDGLDPQLVDDIKEDLDFYLEAYADDPDFLER